MIVSKAGHEARARSVLSAAVAAAALFPFSSALAQDAAPAGLEKLVVTAAGFEQKLVDAPASISVITQEELAKRPYMTLLDAVRDLEGVDVGETRDKTGQGTISMRGMGSDYTLILVNGKRQNNHGDIYPNNFAGNQFNHIPPLDAIERIEVIRGPASTLYGADAMGGVINIITKRTLDRWHGSVSVGRTFETDDAFGDDTTADVFVTGPIVPGKLNLSARGSWYQRDESNPIYSSIIDPAGTLHERSLGFGGGGKTVDNTNKAGGISLEWRPTDNQALTLDFDTSIQEYDNAIKINDSGVEEYPVGTVDNYGAMLRIGNTGRIEPRAGYSPEQEFTRDSWSLTHEGKWDFGNSFLSLAHVSTNNNGRTLPFTVGEREDLQLIWNAACTNLGGTVAGTGFCPTAGTGYANANAWNNLSEAAKLAVLEANLTPEQYQEMLRYLPRAKRTMESRQYTLDAKVDIPFELAGNHTAVLGTQVIRGELEDGVFGMEAGTPSAVQDHNMYSLFAEDTWYVLDPLAITFGLRYDDHEVFGDHVSPRLYGVYTVSPQVTVKGGISTGFKTPKTTQLYDGIIGFGGQGTTPLYGNPDLKPETSVSNELAVYWQHPNGHNFNATVFRNTFDDKLSTEDCGAGLTQECPSGEFADLGYVSGTVPINIDEVVIQGAEVAGRWHISRDFGIRANYTYTDSEQKSGDDAGRPLGNSAKHMANATLDWFASDKLNVFLTAEARSKRYRGQHVITEEELYYKDYVVYHLGASYQATSWLTLNARVNNLLDRDFTTYKTEFRDLNSDGDYLDTNIGCTGCNEALFFDDYNNKDKARAYWISLNARF